MKAAIPRASLPAIRCGLSDGGYFRYEKIFGHIHMAKTAGTEINGELAAHFERVCGHKGYSYDMFHFNERVKKSNNADVGFAGGADLISKQYYKFNRGRVPPNVMKEIGYEDCDYISLESRWREWRTLARIWPVDFHVPCRNPLDHLISQCRHKGLNFHCDADDLKHEVIRCLLQIGIELGGRFHRNLMNIPNTTLKYFNPIPIDPYTEYVSQFLQRKRIESIYIHRETNKPRNKSAECIWNNPEVADRVLEILMSFDYYKFCDDCMGSQNDLLAQ